VKKTRNSGSFFCPLLGALPEFPATGSAWAVKTIGNVALTAGSNSIAVVKDWGYMEVDWNEIAP
jgi:hypothetical protein